MATEFDDSLDWAFFVRGSKTLTNGNGFANRWSEQVLAALRAAGVFDNMVDGTSPPTTDKLWLDKNFDPAQLKQWDATGSSWVPMTYGRLFGLAALGTLAVTGGTANAIVVAQPNSAFQGNRLYVMTPTANNAAGAVTIQVSGVGTYPVKYGNGSNPLAQEFTNGRQTALFFDGSQFIVVFSVGDLNASVLAAQQAASDAAGYASNASTSASNAATSATNAANAAAGVLTGATADDTIDDTDEVIYKTGTTIKRATFAAGVTASIFKSTRTIANGVFAAATFVLKSTGGFNFTIDTSAMTAARALKMDDAPVDLAYRGKIMMSAPASLSGLTLLDIAIPAAVAGTELEEIVVDVRGATLSATQLPLFQFLVGGVLVSTGYDSAGSVIQGSVASQTSAAGFIATGQTNATFNKLTALFRRLGPGSTIWSYSLIGHYTSAGTVVASGHVSLSGEPSAIRLTTVSGVPTFTAGTASLARKYNG